MNAEATTAASVRPERLAELERLHLHNLLLERQVLYGKLETLTLQFLRTQAPKVLQDRIDDITQRINAETERVFSRHGVDPQTHQLDVNHGFFVARDAQRTDHVG